MRFDSVRVVTLPDGSSETRVARIDEREAPELFERARRKAWIDARLADAR